MLGNFISSHLNNDLEVFYLIFILEPALIF